MEEKLVCSECGALVTEENMVEFDGEHLCRDCFNEITTVCECCGRRIWNREAHGDGNIVVCENCYDYNYTHCEECGRLIHNDNAYYEEDSDYPYCYDCFQELEDRPIKNYYYTPDPIFYGSGNLFMGVELEIDRGGECDDNARTILETANRSGEHLYCKHDGSISDGFEMVSHLMTYEYHLNNMNWSDVFHEAVEMGYRSHQTQTCGLHIHVNRSAFGTEYNTQEEVIGRIVYFVESHWNELLKFSRRTEMNINRWASRYGIATTAKDTYKNVKDKSWSRYVAVNLENHNTIEFRLFRGTLRYKTFLATLQLVDRICHLAINMTDKETEEMSWSDFVSTIPSEKNELIEYLKSKKLYVNETLTESEEM